MIGAYPPTGKYDECTTSKDRERAIKAIPRVALPRKDPVYGTTGPLNINVDGTFNTVGVGSAMAGLDLLSGSVVLSGSTTLSNLYIDDGASTASHVYNVDQNRFRRQDKAEIDYRSLKLGRDNG